MGRSLGLQKFEGPEFLETRHMKMGRLSSLRAGRLYPPMIGILLIIFAKYSINIYLAGNHTFEYRDYEHENFPLSKSAKHSRNVIILNHLELVITYCRSDVSFLFHLLVS